MKSSAKFAAVLRLLLAMIVVGFSLALLFKASSTPITVQASQSPTPQEERQFENTVPSHVPIQVKVKPEKEKAFKDLTNEHWLSDLEIEVKNTGTKPIYFLHLELVFDTIGPDGKKIGETLLYGRTDLTSVTEPLKTEDVPIKPGETHVFTIAERYVKGFERVIREDHVAQPRKVSAILVYLNFGDGTGFWGGTPLPHLKKSISRGPCDDVKKRNGKDTSLKRPFIALNSLARSSSFNGSPAFPAGIFLTTESSSPITIDAGLEPDICCPGTSCSWAITSFTRCQCSPINNPDLNDTPYADFLACTDSRGECTTAYWDTRWCDFPMPDGSTIKLSCPISWVLPCTDYPPPPPLPTPTPSPTPDCFSCSSDAQCSCGHCDLNLGICFGNANLPGCSEQFIDNCLDSGGYLPIDFVTHTLICACSNVWGYGGGGGGGGGSKTGCLYSDCSCNPYGNGGECNSTWCIPDAGGWGICADAFIDPILINVGGGDFDLTDGDNGVIFDFFGRGAAWRISWTDQESNDAWLVLDWNKNGKIDNGKEMFSNATPEREPTDSPLGFKALAMFDEPGFGGNSDGVIDQRDRIFRRLRLWQDVNHNGISEPSELHTLPELGVESISLDYRESRRTDRWGNVFRYRAKVYGAKHADLGRWAYDVVLQSAKPSPAPQSTARNLFLNFGLSNHDVFDWLDKRVKEETSEK